MHWRETLAAIDAGERFGVKCPDGITRTVWGHTPTPGTFL